ncbi:DNA gyrase C-terminal beta-propeller domain-containing protein, partial [Candidatus Synechococcus spongiarum]
LMLTQAGFIKRTPLRAFANIRVNGLIAIHLESGDALRWVRLARVGDSVLIGSQSGMAIHVPINDNQLRSMGRTARGVRAMALREGDQVIGMDVLAGDHQAGSAPWVLVASAHGRGKRVAMEEFPLQARAGMGRRALKFRGHGDALISLRILGDAEEVLLVSEQGVIVRLQADQISQQSRTATGVKLQKLGTEDRLVEVVLVPPAPEPEEEAEPEVDP